MEEIVKNIGIIVVWPWIYTLIVCLYIVGGMLVIGAVGFVFAGISWVIESLWTRLRNLLS